MTYTQFFTDSIAATLADALEQAGIGLPVYGQVSDPEAEHDRIEVRCNGTEEIIPGNYTTRLDCSVVLLVSASANDAAEVEQLAATVAPVVNEVLHRPPAAAYGSGVPTSAGAYAVTGTSWKNVPLLDPRAEADAEYEKAPFIVLDLVAEPANVETDGNSYAMQLDFRAYVQF